MAAPQAPAPEAALPKAAALEAPAPIAGAAAASQLPVAAAPAEAVARAFSSAYQEVDDEFIELATQHRYTDGTTVLSLLLRGATLDVANCGDTRAVLGSTPSSHPRFGLGSSRSMRERELEAERLSVDHKPELPDETDRVRAAGGQVRTINGCWRVAGPPGTSTLLAISRAFGDRELKRCTPSPLVSNQPAVSTRTLTPLDKLLILASDGLWDVVDDAQAVKIACEAAKGRAVVHPPPAGPDADGTGSALAAANALVKRAMEAGSLDNVTVLVAWLLWDDDGVLSP